MAACHNSSDSPPQSIGTAPEPTVGATDTLPGVVVTIEAVRGGSGAGGNVMPGDILSVDYTLATTGGDPLEASTLTRGAIMVSGPTFNYQRVIASQADVAAVSVKRALGAFTYTFATAVPATYLAPLNDTTSLTTDELTDAALLAGTYTVGMECRKDYTVGDTTYRDAGNATYDFLVGDATALEPRQVVTNANCNQCHVEVQAHGSNRTRVENCVLCHTAGAEDRNNSAVAGGTPGVTVEFKVMIHKIHMGEHLPSVNGVATNPDGTRNYAAIPVPYELSGFSLADFSHVGFPVWPSLLTPMPRDAGFTTLTPPEQTLENTLRGGVVACDKCHGDPDGSGPLAAPTQGDLAYLQPTRRACGSCHDDWNPEYPYQSNTLTMPFQADDSACKICHGESGDEISVRDAHTHPLVDPTAALGVNIHVTSVTDVDGDDDGTFDPGEKVQITMTIKDDGDNDIPATSLSQLNAVVEGPTTNPNLVFYAQGIPTAAIGAGPTYTFNLPEKVYYEWIGTATGGTDTFATDRAPIWTGTVTVLTHSGVSTSTTLAADAPLQQNFIDVATATGLIRNDYIVIDRGTPALREYMRIQNVSGNRIWFSSPYSQTYKGSLLNDHTSGATVEEVTLSTVTSTNYSVDTVGGSVTEAGAGFTTGNEILISYSTDFVVPTTFPPPYNDSPDLDQSWGEWKGLAIPDGTYDVGVWGARSFTVTRAGENTSYTEGSPPAVTHVLFGSATEGETVERTAGPETCYACHVDIQFHGGSRRGFDTCKLCHTLAGAEDNPNYVSSAGPATPNVTVDFRTMLHKIHAGSELSAGANYIVAGFNGSTNTYEELEFPAFPEGVKKCIVCHGENNTAWTAPADREITSATYPTRIWRAVCGSCHDSNAEQAHIDVNTSVFGYEACTICHGPGAEHEVTNAHLVR
ncbi:MAG: hypothetical protein U1E73_08450 [Planctomycetota bacterium]